MPVSAPPDGHVIGWLRGDEETRGLVDEANEGDDSVDEEACKGASDQVCEEVDGVALVRANWWARGARPSSSILGFLETVGQVGYESANSRW